MNYHSHVLHYPANKPFDLPDRTFHTFVGEFVLPVRSQFPDELMWFTHYGSFAKFRTYTSRYAEMKPTIDAHITRLGLRDDNSEKSLTLVDDLGHGRFLATGQTGKTAEGRALLVLRYLHSIAELVCDNLIREPSGYWQMERSTDHENPNGNNFESLLHLLGNMTQVRLSVELHARTPWMRGFQKGTIDLTF